MCSIDIVQDTGGLQALIKLAVGCRVMLRINVDVSDGLVNGACGWVDSIESSEHGEVKRIYVKFDGTAGQRWCTAAGTATVGVNPHTVRFFGKDGRTVRRRQLPLVLAWAKTIHKSQGATEHYGVRTSLDKKVRMPGQAYVALSRAPSSKLILLDSFNSDCIHVMKGIEWTLNELYIQQAKTKFRTSSTWINRLAEELLRPTHPVEHYEALRHTLPRPTWTDYHAKAQEWNAENGEIVELNFKCPRCGEPLASTKAQRRHNKVCSARTSRKRPAAAMPQQRPKLTQAQRPAATSPKAAHTAKSVSRPTATRWTCGSSLYGQEHADAPDWFNPPESDAVNPRARQQIGATCGFLAALHILAGAEIRPDSLSLQSFRTIGRALEEDEAEDFTFMTIHSYLTHHGVGLIPCTVDQLVPESDHDTVAFLILYLFGGRSRHWVSVLRRDAGCWLLCDSLRSKPFEVLCNAPAPCLPYSKLPYRGQGS